jgi:hypothetical protein
LYRVKNANFFAEFFGEKLFKIITSVPGLFVTVVCGTLSRISEDGALLPQKHSRPYCVPANWKPALAHVSMQRSLQRKRQFADTACQHLQHHQDEQIGLKPFGDCLLLGSF